VPSPTEAQLRILEDFADENPETRHTRAKLHEWNANRRAMLRFGWIASVPRDYFITAKGRAVLRTARLLGQYDRDARRVPNDTEADEQAHEIADILVQALIER
jgi:hypothetical protein